MAASWAELFPPNPVWTEKDMSDQAGRVFLITGGSIGVGYEVAKMLYHLNGIVYITSRSASAAQQAISSIKASSPSLSQTVKPGQGKIDYVLLNLSDLSTIKASADELLKKISRLDVVFHNAAVMLPDNPEEMTAQGYHQQLSVNALGPFLLQTLLTPLVLDTASFPSTPKNSVRVIFVSSSAHRSSPPPDGVSWSDLNLEHTTKKGLLRESERYGQSKAMNVMFAHEYARRYGKHGSGIISLSLHPGALGTGLQKNAPRWFNALFSIFKKEPYFGALTELWAGIRGLEKNEERMLEDGGKNGGYIVPFGRWGDGSKEVFAGLMKRGTGKRVWGVCEDIVKEFV